MVAAGLPAWTGPRRCVCVWGGAAALGHVFKFKKSLTRSALHLKVTLGSLRGSKK